MGRTEKRSGSFRGGSGGVKPVKPGHAGRAATTRATGVTAPRVEGDASPWSPRLVRG
jgi:hypothetical protein